MEPVTAMALLSAGKAGFDWWSRKKGEKDRPKFGESAYGKELKRIQREGKYSPKAKNIITNTASRKFGQIAQDATSDYRGALIAKGMGGSIAGIRGAMQPKLTSAKEVSRVASKTELENEQSKIDAGKTLTEGEYRDSMEAWKLKQANRAQTSSDIAGVATGYVSGGGTAGGMISPGTPSGMFAGQGGSNWYQDANGVWTKAPAGMGL